MLRKHRGWIGRVCELDKPWHEPKQGHEARNARPCCYQQAKAAQGLVCAAAVGANQKRLNQEQPDPGGGEQAVGNDVDGQGQGRGVTSCPVRSEGLGCLDYDARVVEHELQEEARGEANQNESQEEAGYADEVAASSAVELGAAVFAHQPGRALRRTKKTVLRPCHITDK